MDISYDDLVSVLTKHGETGSGVTPREALYIRLASEQKAVASSTVHPTALDGSLVVEFDADGSVVGIELI